MKKTFSTVITAHNNADFDCLSSMIAARLLYPEAALIFPGSQEQSLRDFILQSATYLFNFFNLKDIDLKGIKRLVVCDTRQRSRLPHIAPLLNRKDLEIHLYDHHPDSDDDLQASVQMVKPWGSTTAILVKLIREKGLEPKADEATIMGLGLYEDTGCFTFSSTTVHDLEAAAWLKAKGMEIGFIADFLNRELTSEQVALLNTMLKGAITHNINGVEICITKTSSEHYVRDFAVLVHKMMEIENIKVIFALARMLDRVHVVARSHLSSVDVGTICKALGGGGHPYAASATIKDKTLNQVEEQLFGQLFSQINPQLKVKNLMTAPAITIENKETIAKAATIMTRFGLKAIPVVDKDNHCQGILEHQLAERATTHGLGHLSVDEYMLRNFSQVAPEDSLSRVMKIIIDQGQRLVPVVVDEQVSGVITRTDLINWLIEEPARVPESLLPERKQGKNINSLMRNRLPEKIYYLLARSGELAFDNGFTVYAVGGFVRDILLYRPNLDLDLVVEGNGIEFAKILARDLGGRVRSHRKFQTAVVILEDGQRVDVATARLEYYEHPAALPTVELSSIKMDLFRRDFTINALAIELTPKRFGRLVDFFGGQKDIKERVIRVLHSLSFVEDPTRILRAIRFEQRYSFRIGKQTERLIKNALKLEMFEKLSGNRILHELKLIMQEKSPLTCLERIQDFEILTAIHPVLELNNGKRKIMASLEQILSWYELLYTTPHPEEWIVYFLGLTTGHDSAEISSLAKRLGLSLKLENHFLELHQEIQRTRERLYFWNKNSKQLSKLYFILNPLPVEGILYIMAFSRNEEIRKHISLYLSQLKDETIDIGGRDLKKMGLRPGPVYGEIFRKILAAKLDGQAQDHASQLALARQLAAEFKDPGED